MPLISIIIATYNVENDLQKCLNSIVLQIKNIAEILVIDGGSTDNTVELIKSNKKNIAYWISEPDKGIYDAWNKGILHAKGGWIMFLGADDLLVENTLEIYREYLEKENSNDNLEFISCKNQIVDSNNKPIRLKGGKFKWPLFLKKMTIAHPGALHSKILFEKYGNFNPDIKIVGDYEFLLRAGSTLNTHFINRVSVRMRNGGASDTTASLIEHYKVVTKIAHYSEIPAFFNLMYSYAKFVIRICVNSIYLIFK